MRKKASSNDGRLQERGYSCVKVSEVCCNAIAEALNEPFWPISSTVPPQLP